MRAHAGAYISVASGLIALKVGTLLGVVRMSELLKSIVDHSLCP